MTAKADKNKEARGSGMPWEEEYGYAQAVKVGRQVYIAGQVGTDQDGKLLIGMEAQMQQAYLNIEKLLISYGMGMDSVVEEVVYVTDIAQAFSSRAKLGRMVYPNVMSVPSTLLEVQRLALDGQLVEIKILARKPRIKKVKIKEKEKK